MAGVASEIKDWFAARVPEGWASDLDVTADGDEILVVLDLAAGEGEPTPKEKKQDRAAGLAHIDRFREETREQRMQIASEAERLFNRKVSWGATSGGTTRVFTHLRVPVMTRLGLKERVLLDTLVASGVARSRSHALAWCARLVADNQEEWLAKLRKATAEVEKVRREGPTTISMV